MENRKTCRNAQCFCDGSCQDLIKSDINYTSVIPMENKTAEEIYELAERLMQSESLEASAIILRDFAEKCYQEGAVDAQNDAAKAMEEYASQQLAEKDKEIERFAIRFAEWISSQNYKNHTSNGWSVVNRGAGSCDVKPTYSTEQLIELYKQSLNK